MPIVLILKTKSMNKFNQFNIDTKSQTFVGKHIDIEKIFNADIIVHKYKIGPSKYVKEKGSPNRLDMQITFEGEMRVIWTGSVSLMEQIEKVPKPSGFPFETKITRENKRYSFN